MGRAVGLDIGARHVRLVEVDGGGRGMTVHRLGERDLVVPEGADREEAVREAVDALFRDTRASRDEVVMTWPAESCTIREISVPFRDPVQIRKVVKFEFESHLHASAIEDVVLDFVSTGDTKEGARLLCVAAPKAPLRARLESLAKVKVEPLAVDLDATSLAAAAAAAGLLAENPDCVLVDVGSRSTKIVVVREGRVRAARSFLGGVEEPAPGIASAAAADPAGEPAVDAAAVPSTTALASAEDRRAGGFARVAREIARTLANAAPGVAFPVTFVSGRAALAPGAREAMAAGLGMEVRPLDVLARIQHPVPAESAAETALVFATALGAAARALGIGPVAMDLRREELHYARRFDQVKGGIAAVLGLLLLAVGLLLWRANVEKEEASREFAAMLATFRKSADPVERDYHASIGEEQAKKLWAGTGEQLDTVTDARRRVGQMHDHLRNEMGLSTEVPPIRSCLEILKQVNGAVRGVREKLDYCLVTTQSYNQREVQIDILLSAPDQADILQQAFRDIKGADGALFKDVAYGKVAQNKQGKWPVPFSLRFEKK